MDDGHREDGNAQEHKSDSGGYISDLGQDAFHREDTPGIGKEDEKTESISTMQQEDPFRFEKPDLRLVSSESSESSEAEKRRQKRRKKIERRMKRKQRRKKIRKVLLILLLIGIAAGIATWLFFSSAIFVVSEITVNHNTLKSDRNIINESGIKVGENIFQFDKKDAIKEILAQNPYISDVEISRKLPNKVVITVSEHAPTAAIKYDGKYLILDKSGRVAGEEKTQITATRLTGVEIKHYEKGEVPIVQNSLVFKESMKLINKVNASGMFFKKLDVSSSLIVHGYFTDDLECAGEAEDIIDNLEGIKAIIYDLNQKKTMKGTIYVGDDGYATFSPASDENTLTENTDNIESTDKTESTDKDKKEAKENSKNSLDNESSKEKTETESSKKNDDTSTSKTKKETESSDKNTEAETAKDGSGAETAKTKKETESSKKNDESEITKDNTEANSADNNVGKESSKSNSKTDTSGNKN